MNHEHHTAEESGAILERLRIEDEIEDVTNTIMENMGSDRRRLRAELEERITELLAQLQELDA